MYSALRPMVLEKGKLRRKLTLGDVVSEIKIHETVRKSAHFLPDKASVSLEVRRAVAPDRGVGSDLRLGGRCLVTSLGVPGGPGTSAAPSASKPCLCDAQDAATPNAISSAAKRTGAGSPCGIAKDTLRHSGD